LPGQQSLSSPGHSFFPQAGQALLSSAAGMLVSLFPGIGAAQAAFIVRSFVGKISTQGYLVLLGGINTANIIFTFFALYFLGKPRTGVAAAVKEILPVSWQTLLFFSAAILVVSGLAVVLTLFLGRLSLSLFQRLDYQKINLAVLGLVLLLVSCLSNALGFLVFLTATAIGLYALSVGVKRTQAMAFLILPVLAFYLGF
jgi:putative membrane protein